jgi:hypothetical protein
VADANLTGTFTVNIKAGDGIFTIRLNGLIEKPSSLIIAISGSLGNGKSSFIEVPIAIIPDPILK